MTCTPCRATLMQTTLEANLGWRPKFWGRSNDLDKIRHNVRVAVLEARGRSITKTQKVLKRT